MNTGYIEIDFKFGASLEECINELLQYKEKGVLVCAEFNKHIFLSDTVTMDSAYIKVFGVTKEGFEKAEFDYNVKDKYINNIKNKNMIIEEVWDKFKGSGEVEIDTIGNCYLEKELLKYSRIKRKRTSIVIDPKGEIL